MAPQPLKIAILAMGGEGGGVLADWIVDLGEHNGQLAQTTSVPGVAQRTGATIYYVELFPADARRGRRRRAGAGADADAGRRRRRPRLRADGGGARGPARPGHARPHDAARLDPPRLVDHREDRARRRPGRQRRRCSAHARAAAQRLVRFDMAEAAEQAGSVISAVLFGALAGTGVLPFSRAAVRGDDRARRRRRRRQPEGLRRRLRARSGERWRAAAEAGAWRASSDGSRLSAPSAATVLDASGAAGGADGIVGAARIRPSPPCVERARQAFPPPRRPMRARRRAPPDRLPGSGLRRASTSTAWRACKAPRRAPTAPARRDRAPPRALDDLRRHDPRRRPEDARHPLRARPGRGARRADQLLAIDEYLHPRLQEIAETLPAALGRWLERPGWLRRLVERFTAQGPRSSPPARSPASCCSTRSPA